MWARLKHWLLWRPSKLAQEVIRLKQIDPKGWERVKYADGFLWMYGDFRLFIFPTDSRILNLRYGRVERAKSFSLGDCKGKLSTSPLVVKYITNLFEPDTQVNPPARFDWVDFLHEQHKAKSKELITKVGS